MTKSGCVPLRSSHSSCPTLAGEEDLGQAGPGATEGLAAQRAGVSSPPQPKQGVAKLVRGVVEEPWVGDLRGDLWASQALP